MLLDSIAKSSPRLCFLDAGNSRVKAMRCTAHKTFYPGGKRGFEFVDLEFAEVLAPESYLSLLPPETTAFVASVRSENYGDAARHLRIYQIRVPSVSASLTPAYKKLDDLGVDRWLAMMAARAACPRKLGASGEQGGEVVLVIDFGTALTADLIQLKSVGPDQHLGGWILPGAKLQYQAINQTGRIRMPEDAHLQAFEGIGTSTESCVRSAVHLAEEGFLRAVIEYARLHSSDLRIIGTGGGLNLVMLKQLCEQVCQGLSTQCAYRPHLVLEGIQQALSCDEDAFATL